MAAVVTVPTKTTALVTLEAVKSYLQITDSQQDAALTLLIAQASQACVSRLQRPIALQEYRERLRFRGRVSAINLSVGPIVAIRSILVDGRPAASLDLLDVDRDQARIEQPGCLDKSSPPYGYSDRVFEITYLAGFLLPGVDEPARSETDLLPVQVEHLPADLERGCLSTIQMLLCGQGRDPLLRTESIEGVGSASWQVQGAGAGGLSPDAQAALDRLSIAADWMA